MSVESMSLVLKHSKASGTPKVVLIGIANHDGDGGAWPSIDTLAEYAQVSPRNVSKAIAKLVAMGELEVHVNAGGNEKTAPDRRPNLYRILVKAPESNGMTKTTPRPDNGVSNPTQRGVESDTNGMSPATPEPSFNHPELKNSPQPPASGGPTKCSRHKARPKAWCEECNPPEPTPIPTWCGQCDPAGEHNPGQRFIEIPPATTSAAFDMHDTVLAKCPRCHPAAQQPRPEANGP